jgi:uncharacterized protein DUF6166
MSKVTYIGAEPEFGEASVFRLREGVDPARGTQLSPRLDLRQHSPTGFAWGYGGSGPAQLSLAILADYFGNDERALRLYQDFKFRVIGRLPQGERWMLTEREITEAVGEIEQRRGWVWLEEAGRYDDQIMIETA